MEATVPMAGISIGCQGAHFAVIPYFFKTLSLHKSNVAVKNETHEQTHTMGHPKEHFYYSSPVV